MAALRTIRSSDKSRTRFYLTSFIIAMSLLGDGMIYTVLPSSPGDFGIKIWQIGILLAANRIIRLFTNEIAGQIVNSDNSIKPLVFAAAFSVLVTYSYTIPWGFPGLLFSRICWGACFSLLRLEGYLSAIRYSSTHNRSRIIGIFHSITRLGAGGGAIAGGLLTDLIGFRLTFFLFGTLIAGSLFFTMNRGDLSRPLLSNPLDAEKSLRMRKKERKMLIMLGSSVFAIVFTDQMFTNLTGRIVADYILPDFPAVIGAASLTGLLLGTRHLMAFSAPLIGWVCDRAGRKRILYVILSAEALIALSFSLARVWYVLFAAVIAHYLASSAAGVIIYSYAGDKAPEGSQAVFMSRFTTFNDLGIAAGPLLGFLLYSAGDGLFWAGIAALPMLAAAFIIIRKV